MKAREQKKERSVLDIIDGIRSGQIDPKSIINEERIPCVEFMMSRGCGTAYLVKYFSCSDRTIRRDKVAIRKNNAVKIDDKFTNEHVSELITTERNIRMQLLTIASSKETSVSDKIQALNSISKGQKDLTIQLKLFGVPNLKLEQNNKNRKEENTKNKKPNYTLAQEEWCRMTDLFHPMHREEIRKVFEKALEWVEKDEEEENKKANDGE